MGLYGYCLAGSALIAIGIYESLVSSITHLTIHTKTPPKHKTPPRLIILSISTSIISLSFIINALISLRDSLQSHDPTGLALQLQISTVGSLFLLHSLLPLLPIPLPRSLPRLILSSAFAQEFLHFYLHRKDPSGLENRYFDLMLLPVSLCAVSALLRPDWAGGLARGVGLVMQGAWFVQMGFSFFTDWGMARGCALHQRSAGNFTVKCKGHMDEHRSMAIATLQFNCLLALIVIGALFVYSVVARVYGVTEDCFNGSSRNYTPLNAELGELSSQARFALDDGDDDGDDGDGEIVGDVERNGVKMKSVGGAPELGVNGFGDHE
ncbi:hypothetical protein Scep_017694 [Stephania cephalantha]|uniref:Uncharacterized protein n=1 Tax=Stephania cephalantha TaxID=152367 RepID=A0AAP0IQ09_9MAGN